MAVLREHSLPKVEVEAQENLVVVGRLTRRDTGFDIVYSHRWGT